MTKLVVLESPNKIKKFQKVLGNGYKVAASVGHIREPAKAFDLNLGFQIVEGKVEYKFKPTEKGSKNIKNLKALAKQCDELIIATDDDREGEAIGWHVREVVGTKMPYSRIVTDEITEKGIRKAIANPRKLDMNVIHAQMTRQFLDRSYGYRFSPLIYNDTDGEARSVGRVQTAALFIVAERHLERKNFKPETYWSIVAQYREGFTAAYAGGGGASSTPDEDEAFDDASSGDESQEEGTRVTSQEEADRIVAEARGNAHTILAIEGKETEKKPPAPLTTSSLQQLAGSRHNLSPDETMSAAQKLFENGLITYHRTDSTTLSEDAKASIKAWLQANQPDLVPDKVVKQKQRAGAQAAHEAIRPTEVGTIPEQASVSGNEATVYTLIWQRAVASQCANAKFRKTNVSIGAGKTRWEAKGSIMTFDGFNRMFKASGGDKELPELSNRQQLSLQDVTSQEKQTQPPGLFTEPRLVAMLEKKGIGRPSTYASIMKTISTRGYVKATGKKKVLDITPLGLNVHEWVSKKCSLLGNLGLTKQMEDGLDAIASGKTDWENYLDTVHAQVILPTYEKIKTTSKAVASKSTEYKCLACGEPLVEKGYKKKGGGIGKMLVCPKDTDRTHPAFFYGSKGWFSGYGEPRKEFDPNLTLDDLKGEAKRKGSGKKTEYVCQTCGERLTEFSYKKEGKPKTMLKCPADNTHPVYFWTTKQAYWNPNGVPLSKTKERHDSR